MYYKINEGFIPLVGRVGFQMRAFRISSLCSTDAGQSVCRSSERTFSSFQSLFVPIFRCQQRAFFIWFNLIIKNLFNGR